MKNEELAMRTGVDAIDLLDFWICRISEFLGGEGERFWKIRGVCSFFTRDSLFIVFFFVTLQMNLAGGKVSPLNRCFLLRGVL